MDRVIMDWPTEFIVTEIAGVPPSCLRQASRALESRFPKMVQKVHVRHRESSRKAHIGSYIDRVFSGCLEIII